MPPLPLSNHELVFICSYLNECSHLLKRLKSIDSTIFIGDQSRQCICSLTRSLWQGDTARLTNITHIISKDNISSNISFHTFLAYSLDCNCYSSLKGDPRKDHPAMDWPSLFLSVGIRHFIARKVYIRSEGINRKIIPWCLRCLCSVLWLLEQQVAQDCQVLNWGLCLLGICLVQKQNTIYQSWAGSILFANSLPVTMVIFRG